MTLQQLLILFSLMSDDEFSEFMGLVLRDLQDQIDVEEDYKRGDGSPQKVAA